MSDKHPWDQIIYNIYGGSVAVTSFTADTTATGLVPKPGYELRIYEILVASPSIAVTEGIGDVLFGDG